MAYTKVLEQFAEIYLKTDGKLLEEMDVPTSVEATAASSSITTRGTYAEMLERVERVELDNREFVSAFEILIHRVEALESQISCNELGKRVEHLEQAVQYREQKSKKSS